MSNFRTCPAPPPPGPPISNWRLGKEMDRTVGPSIRLLPQHRRPIFHDLQRRRLIAGVARHGALDPAAVVDDQLHLVGDAG